MYTYERLTIKLFMEQLCFIEQYTFLVILLVN